VKRGNTIGQKGNTISQKR